MTALEVQFGQGLLLLLLLLFLLLLLLLLPGGAVWQGLAGAGEEQPGVGDLEEWSQEKEEEQNVKSRGYLDDSLRRTVIRTRRSRTVVAHVDW